MFPFFRRRRHSPSPPTPKKPPATLSAGVRIYAIGDIHGRADLLHTLHQRIEEHRQHHPSVDRQILVYLGDYIDRGPASREVLDTLITPHLPGMEIITLIGNHEAMLADFLKDPIPNANWLGFGGDATLASYGIFPDTKRPTQEWIAEAAGTLMTKMPLAHLEFLAALTTRFDLDDYLFVHAGIDPERPLDDQDPRDLIWIRSRFFDHSGPFEKVIVHGHSILEQPELLPHRIGIDTGAYYSGRLTCLVLEGERREILQTRRSST
ncbi:MAG: serine/threonine protein phosphatase [Magnetococcales bacterium]|nr:serine/threonine protein phosphatase [Magnetococcales bacterium]